MSPSTCPQGVGLQGAPGQGAASLLIPRPRPFFPVFFSASFFPDKLCVSVQHRQDPHDKAAGVHYL